MKRHTIYSVSVDTYNRGAIDIRWVADCGFGQYTLQIGSGGKWLADSECMDKGDDKSFLKSLMEKFIEEVDVEG